MHNVTDIMIIIVGTEMMQVNVILLLSNRRQVASRSLLICRNKYATAYQLFNSLSVLSL